MECRIEKNKDDREYSALSIQHSGTGEGFRWLIE